MRLEYILSCGVLLRDVLRIHLVLCTIERCRSMQKLGSPPKFKCVVVDSYLMNELESIGMLFDES